MKRFALLALVLFCISTSAFGAEFRVGTWNIEWFFDENTADDTSSIGYRMAAPSANDHAWRVSEVAAAIAEMDPHVMALQEIENDTVVQDVADRLAAAHGKSYMVAFVQGKDTYTGQDVAFLVRDGISFQDERFPYTHQGDSDYKDLSKHCHLTMNFGGEDISLVVVHLITSLDKRKLQAKTLREWTKTLAQNGNVIVLGDFNVGLRYANTTPNSDIGTIRGLNEPGEADDLFDLHEYLSGDDRQTHVSGKQLDRVLVSPALHDNAGLRFQSIVNRYDLAIRGNDVDDGPYWSIAAAERDLSDHFPLVATFTTDTPPDDYQQLIARLDALDQQLQELRTLIEERIGDNGTPRAALRAIAPRAARVAKPRLRRGHEWEFGEE